MTHFIVYQGERDFLHAMLIREDGVCLADHICSSPGWMPGDLYDNRPERKAKWGDIALVRTPHHIDDFKEKFPEVFAKAFKTNDEMTAPPAEESRAGVSITMTGDQ